MNKYGMRPANSNIKVFIFTCKAISCSIRIIRSDVDSDNIICYGCIYYVTITGDVYALHSF